MTIERMKEAGCMARIAILAAGAISAFGATAALAEDSPTPVRPFEHVSCKNQPNEIRVTIDNVKQSVGLMTIELYRDDPEGFLKKAGREYRVRYAARAPATEICLYAPTPGKWAVAAYHDVNANTDFDKNAFGLPAEPYGVSGNPKIRFGPPPIEEALVDVPESGASIEIRLKN